MWMLIVSVGGCNNPAQKRCELHADNKSKSRHALIIFSNIYCLSAATVVTRTRLITLYVHCLSCFPFVGIVYYVDILFSALYSKGDLTVRLQCYYVVNIGK